MIDKNLIRSAVESAIAGSDVFIVDINVDASNRIVVELDAPQGIDIDTIAEFSRKIEASLDRDAEDFELEVGTAGLTAPFKVTAQYMKYLGKDVEVITPEGKKVVGTLAAVDGSAGTFTIEVPTKVKVEGKKRPEVQMVPQVLDMAACKSVKYHLSFK